MQGISGCIDHTHIWVNNPGVLNEEVFKNHLGLQVYIGALNVRAIIFLPLFVMIIKITVVKW